MNNWKCKHCVHWKEREGMEYGECHRNPPGNKPETSPLSQKPERYKITHGDFDYCGEFEEISTRRENENDCS